MKTPELIATVVIDDRGTFAELSSEDGSVILAIQKENGCAIEVARTASRILREQADMFDRIVAGPQPFTPATPPQSPLPPAVPTPTPVA